MKRLSFSNLRHLIPLVLIAALLSWVVMLYTDVRQMERSAAEVHDHVCRMDPERILVTSTESLKAYFSGHPQNVVAWALQQIQKTNNATTTMSPYQRGMR